MRPLGGSHTPPTWARFPKSSEFAVSESGLGNIQIGSEAVFDSLYTEERFNRWCVGELHILDSRIIPNARRDYFQPGVHLRHLENRLAPVLREISTRCRRESTIRNSDKRALSELSNIENLHSLAASGYLTDEDSTGLVQKALRKVQEVRKSLRKGNLDTDSLERLDTVEELLTGFSSQAKPQKFDNMTPSEAVVYQKVFGALSALTPSPGTAKELIEMVFTETSRVERNGSGIELDQRAGLHSQTSVGSE